jgi:chemotaxis protein CheD
MQQLKDHFLYPSTLYVSTDATRVQTILGSCVSICLFDPIRSLGGLNHFMLPTWNGDGSRTPKFGDVALTQLIEELIALGCNRKAFVAKVFGGSSPNHDRPDDFTIGLINIAFAENALAQAGIPIISRSIGGKAARKLIYFTHNNEVLIKQLLFQP